MAIAALSASLFAWPLTSAQAATFQGHYRGTTSQGFAYALSLTNATAGQVAAGYMAWSVTTKIVVTCPTGQVTEVDRFSSIALKVTPTGHFSSTEAAGRNEEIDQGVFSGNRVTGTMHVSWLLRGKMCTTGLIRFTATRTSSAGTTTHPATKTVACANWNDFSNLTLYTTVHATAITCAQARIVEQGFEHALHQGSGPSGPVHVGTFTCRDHLRLGINRLSGAGSCVNGAGGAVTFVATVLAQ